MMGKQWKENHKYTLSGYADLTGNVIQVVLNRCIATCFPNICISEDISCCQVSRELKAVFLLCLARKKITYFKNWQGTKWR